MNETLEEYAQRKGISLSTVRHRLKLAGFAFDRNAQVTPQLLGLLESKPRRKANPKPAPITPERVTNPTTTPEPVPAPTEIVVNPTPANGRQFLLDVPTAAELLSVFVGATWLFGALGALAAIAAISFYVHTALELRAGVNQFAQEFGLWVCAGLGCVFCWLHGQTFFKVYQGAQDLKFWVCCGCALILSGISFFALVQTRATSVQT